MARILFIGRIYPPSVSVTMHHYTDVQMQDESNGQQYAFRVSVNKSVVTVGCEVLDYSDSLFTRIYISALDIARATVDLVAFANGFGLTVLFHSFITPDGTRSQLLLQDRSLSSLCTAFTISGTVQAESGTTQFDINFDKIFRIVLAEPPLFMALNDLTVAISQPHQAPVSCARAVEGICRLFRHGNDSRADAWRSLRSSLRVTQSYLKLITDTSAAPRHGDRSYIPSTLTDEIVKRSWNVMNRFLEFRKRGNTDLPPDIFPVLDIIDKAGS